MCVPGITELPVPGITELKEIITSLVEERKLVRGKFVNYRECHIEPDWLLIYKVEPAGITFVRTGTHSDLFG